MILLKKHLNKINNPVYKELINLKLISNKNLRIISNNTRNKKIKVIQDTKKKIIFLEKYLTNIKYYKTYKHQKKRRKNQTIVNINNKKILLTGLNDGTRRYKQFKKFLNNKHILDFGCGPGKFLKEVKNTRYIYGVEINKDDINFAKKNYPKILIKENINNFSSKFDLITMFHVLEHLPGQVKILKQLKKKIKKGGKIIIEVPHANDLLISILKNEAFKKFTFWEQHLILHTEESLKKILAKAGFKNIRINYFQRYGLDNHFGWIYDNKPGGHLRYNKYFGNKKKLEYKKNLEKNKYSDTLIAVAKNI